MKINSLTKDIDVQSKKIDYLTQEVVTEHDEIKDTVFQINETLSLILNHGMLPYSSYLYK